MDFDGEAFFLALRREKLRRSLNWSQVAEEAQVSPSVLYRINEGGTPSLENAVRLTAWLGTPGDLTPYLKPDRPKPSEP